MEKYYLPHSTKCFICGGANEVGLKCRFYTDGTGKVYTSPAVSRAYAGFSDVVHGGIQTALLDEAMGWCGFTGTELSRLCFTREINLKFRKNVAPLSSFTVEAELTGERRGLIYTKGIIKDEVGAVLTSATGVFVPIPEDMMAGVQNQLLFLDDGRHYYRKALELLKPLASKI